MTRLACFKAYDIRGRLGVELDAGIVRDIGRSFARAAGLRRAVIGRDCRDSSPALQAAAVEGLIAEAVEVLDLGLCGTEEVYAATGHFGTDGGIMITASHNPAEWNGMKLVGRGAAPLGAATGLSRVQALAEAGGFGPPRPGGRLLPAAGARAAYVALVLSFVDIAALRPLKILVNCGNGAAGPTFAAIAAALAERGAPLTLVPLHAEPDGGFPNGIPNPLLVGNRAATAQAVTAAGADFGVAFDGDFDRCFLFDAAGGFVEGEHVVALLAETFLGRFPGAAIAHDSRAVLAIRDAIARGGGRPVQTRTGHAFLKQALRDSGAVYGGELSAHHYFRGFHCCDSGMIPWLLVAELIGRTGQGLDALVGRLRAAFPSSGEVNFRPADAAAALARVEARFAAAALHRDTIDGLSLEFGDWRLNLRGSNTEPLLRLTVEARGDAGLVAARLAEISALIGG